MAEDNEDKITRELIGDTLLTPQEIAQALRLSKTTVYNLLKSGRLKGYQINSIWRIPKKEFERYMAESFTSGSVKEA